MRKESLFLSLATALVLVLPGVPASAQSYSQSGRGVQIDVGIFYDDLSPYGDWVEMPDYGWSFAPRVDRDWRPYTRGQWIWTDYGWYWDSDEDFGWASYHYGRWVNDRYYGWVWIPGTEWAPAWVSWRHGNGYTGWAPLPPRAIWRTRIGLSIGGLEIDAYIGARDYNFVPDRSFVDRGLYQRVLPATQNVTIINVTNNVTNYTIVNQTIVNGGISIANVEQAVGRRVARARTFDTDKANAPRRASADEVAIYRPQVRSAAERRPAQGRSLVKGDAPPPLLVERRKEREQGRRELGNEADATARDVAQRRPSAQPRDNRQGERPPAKTLPNSGVQPQGAQRQRDQAQEKAQQDAARLRAKDQDQQQRDQQQRDRQQVDQQRAKQDSDAKAQADRRTKEARPKPAPTRPPEQPQAPRADPRDRQQEAQQQRDQARQNADKQRAQDQNQQRADQAKQRANDQQQRDQQQANQQRAKQEQAQADKRAKDAPPPAKDNTKDKGKKDPKFKPTPGPA